MGSRSALVTGASRGIGACVARRLAHEGYSLTLASRSPDPLGAMRDALLEEGADCQSVVTDMRSEESVERLAGAHAERYRGLDVLVLNAGVGRSEPVEALTLRALDLQVGVNLRSAFQLVREAIPLLRLAAAESPGRGARVVGVASITGVVAEAGLAAYGATKAALISLCESVSLEHSAEGISATAISPGYVRTAMSEWVTDRIPAEEMIPPEDVAEMVAGLTRLSVQAVVPHIVMTRRGDTLWRA